MKMNKYLVKNLPGADRVPSIKESIHSHQGINSVRVDMQAETVTVDYDDARYSESEIRNFVSQAGLTVVNTIAASEKP